MGNKRNAAIMLILLVAGICACQKDKSPEPIFAETLVLPQELFDYSSYEFPPHFNSILLDIAGSTPADNPTTNEGATLGRVLFYDKSLSLNRSTSCSSCHHQERGFADGSSSSEGFNGGHTSRNSSHLVNLEFNRRMFWDTRANNLETQVLLPIQDELEMGMELEDLIVRLEATEYYPTLFDAAFDTPEINSDRISKALAQFVRSIVSYQTKWDLAQVNDFQDYTDQELFGKELFYNGHTRCNQCHLTNNFYLSSPRMNGLDTEYEDGGQFNVTGNESDHGQFKVPSLRNSEVSGPYMHDGRFATLMEVVEHYNSGIQPHTYLDDRLTVELTVGGTPRTLDLSEEEKLALVAFLGTLTDHELLNDLKYSSPFIILQQ